MVIIIVQSNMKPKYFSYIVPSLLYQNEFEMIGKDSFERVISPSIVCLARTWPCHRVPYKLLTRMKIFTTSSALPCRDEIYNA